jgi:hypothetical protein
MVIVNDPPTTRQASQQLIPVPLQHFLTGEALLFEGAGTGIRPIDLKPSEVGQPPLGFAAEISSANGTTWLAYWADKRQSADTAPLYGAGLNIYLGGEVFHFIPEVGAFKLSERINCRSIELSQGARSIRIAYPWPIWREALPRIFGDPSSFMSKDIAFELAGLFKFYVLGRL